ncbi:MAG: hypothetical protein KDC34_19010 [Saprospiraceae bacterium]|nr:hypothetical protein [Saprospiraceae bacterium]
MNLPPFLTSSNFWNNLIATVLAVLITYGINIPPDAPQAVIDALFAADWLAAAIALYNLGNILYHIFKGSKDSKEKEAIAERAAERALQLRK